LNDFYRKEDESFFEYSKRLLYGKESGLYDIDKSEIYELIFGSIASPDHARKVLTGVKKFIEMNSNEHIENISDNDMLSRIKIEKEEIKKERIKLSTENLDYNRRLREQSRCDMFEEKLLETILNKKSNIIIPKYKIEHDENNEREDILCITDAHYGAEFRITGMMSETLNEYSPEIFEKRMWNLLEKTISFANKNNVKHINIFDLDDSIEGILHTSQLLMLRYGIIDSVIGYANFMEMWINELSKYLHVKLMRAKGNHNDLRLLGGKKGDFQGENTSKIITQLLRKGLKDNKNVEIIGHNNNGHIYTKIANFDILASHGQDERGNLEKAFKDYLLAFKVNIDYFFTGHLHSTYIKEIGVNKEVIQSPSIMGTNDFALSINKTSNAGAKITTLVKDYGRQNEYNIILR